MTRRTLALLLLSAAALAAAAPGDDPAGAPSGESGEASSSKALPEGYALIYQCNIFSSQPTSAAAAAPAPVDEAPPPDPLRSWLLRGCLSDERGPAAMLEDIANPGTLVLARAGDEVAGCRVEAVSLDDVEIVAPDDQRRRIAVGGNLAGGFERATPVIHASTASAAAGPADGGGAAEALSDDGAMSILERLRQRRRQQGGD